MGFFNEEILEEFPVLMENIKLSMTKKEILRVQNQDMKVLFYKMLKNKFAYTDISLSAGLQFIVEYHSIRQLRNTINHASEEQQIISSKDIISKIENLINAIEKKHWENITVMDELKNL